MKNASVAACPRVTLLRPLILLLIPFLSACGQTTPVSPTVPPAQSPTATPASGVPNFGTPIDLLELPPAVRMYQFSPDGNRIGYQLSSVGADGSIAFFQLVVLELDGGPALPLISSTAEMRFSWFPDSRRLLVVTEKPELQLLVQPLDGGPGRSLVLVKDLQGIGEAVASPGGRWVAYTVFHDAGPAPVPAVGIELVGVDGSSNRQLVAPDFFIGRLAWSADGRWLTYFQGRGGTPPEDGDAYVVSVDGGFAPSKLLPRARAVAWSPDGRQVLWLGEPIQEDGLTRLLVSGWPAVEPATTVATQVEASGVAWVGDGGWVAFARDGALELVAAGAGEVATIEGTDEGARAPAWLPGRGLAYHGGEPVRLRLCPLEGR